MLHHDEWNFVTSANGDKDAEIYRGQPIPMNVYSHLYYEQKINPTLGKHVAKAYVNNVLVNEFINNDPKDYNDVKVYVSHPLLMAADVVIKDFKYGAF